MFQKLSSVILASTVSDISASGGTSNLATSIRRTLTGDFAKSAFSARKRRAEIDGAKGFRPLAMMMAYMNGADEDSLEDELGALEDTYTNYGCYCWINGVEGGVTGGGRTKDMSDHHCKELYRCYKCVNIDYTKNYTDVSYTVDLQVDENGNRQLDCGGNSKTDAENICECDKRFAENIAETREKCDAGEPADSMYGEHCMDHSQFKTTNAGGSFVPQDQCDKQFHGHDKNRCCGIYPNRYPYDDNHKECCQSTVIDDQGTLTSGSTFGSTSGSTSSLNLSRSNS